ncbi:TIGR03545 family protein [Thalassotalea sp. ND16A]|uniref:TIGR03545 family protein n=1 Tax=Thalassotalea sp. ND16A TaxID=1535422 RepID=UPI00051A5268|nr:TIGR03545 family protein [Thalassotalea sp. ND16A]KGK00415.1 hypothetical protein ND16A_3492 [Thalassotalea sp. ND16A]
MAKYFRWQGLLGFVATITVIAALLFILAPSIAKVGLEKGIAWYSGAEVNIDDVDINWSPLVLTINHLQITDNENPSHNVVAFDKASAGIDFAQYLFGNLLIEELTITGIRIDQERDTVGEVYRDANTSITDETVQSLEQQMPSIENQLPEINDILNDSNLLTVKAGQQLELTYQQEKQKLNLLKAQLPSKQAISEYQAKVKQLSKSKVKSVDDLSRLKQELEVLKKQFKQDQTLVKSAKLQLKESRDNIAKAVTAVKTAPKQDWQQLKSKYQLDKVDNADFAHILFGENARQYYQQAESFYLRIKPFIESSNRENAAEQGQRQQSLASGRFVQFIDENPLPPWLIKQAYFQLTLAEGSFEFQLSELTSEHWHRNQPTLVKVNTTKLLAGGEAELSARVFNNNENIRAQGDWQFMQIPVKDAKLREQDNLSLAMASAEVAGVGQFSFIDSVIDSANEFNISNARYTGASTSSIGRALLGAIDGVEQFSLSVGIAGQIHSPSYQVKSDLDNVISNAIAAQLQQKVTTFQRKLQSGLKQKVSQTLAMDKTQAAELGDIETLLNDTDKALKKLMKSKIADSKKKDLEDKLKEKLGKLFG